ncbi:hypothetical protein E1B28_002572 [Marasmius oreades]|uniref:Aminotransferase class I/classII large domain-containing protein n=1 Tax=Marasmius oreades TaxID=181124 RepID=A0A9P7ULZ5_9AGAR|nr:uncharacterized protein E1B28_002572 [Marasmius oreades]KAG7086630.1 hypothetical protein E1B28_002572 [Marasmius oreades]
MSSTSSALNQALEATLESRAKRRILRRLPPPSTPTATTVVDFTSNDYLSLSISPHLHNHLLTTLSHSEHILGSGGSRLLVNPVTHHDLELRLATFFRHTQEGTLLFNSGYDANVSFFSTVPQPGDVVVYDEYIHASVHDGLRSGCRAQKRVSFRNNDTTSLISVLEGLLDENDKNGLGLRLRNGTSSLFLAVETVYSMDGTFAPLKAMIQVLEDLLPCRNGYLIADEAHATGLYGPQGRGRVALEGLEGHPRILARLCTFGKALAATGAVILTTPLVARYMTNYARPLVYTTALSHLAIIAASCSFDMLEDGTAEALAERVLGMSRWFSKQLREQLREENIGTEFLRVGIEEFDKEEPERSSLHFHSPIIPLLTPPPPSLTENKSYSPAHDLSSHLLTKYRIHARPITWPTVPKGQDRVRICLHAGHTEEQVAALVEGVVEWGKMRARAVQEGRVMVRNRL